ncbi:MAG: autotransporter-associated beta strand repeat-containing protein [Chthoniobacterales bacterium]
MKIFARFLLALLFTLPHVLQAGSATWNLDPTSSDWNTAVNWTPATVPRLPSDTASFAVSQNPNLSLSAPIDLGEMIFNTGASPYTIGFDHGRTLNLFGAGIINDSGVAQTFNLQSYKGVIAQMVFNNGATAGDGTVFSVSGPSILSSLLFLDTSDAGSSTITLSGGIEVFGSHIDFVDSSSAGTATITNEGGRISGAQGGLTNIGGSATADQATLIAEGGMVAGAGGGIVLFGNTAKAGGATLIADGRRSEATGGVISFLGASTGGRARVQLSGNGTLEIAGSSRGVVVGSIEGSGLVSLGANNLTVGGANRDTTFSGVISGEAGRPGGSLTKTGSGRLVLANGSTFFGGVNVIGGELVVNNRTGSATGTGLVQVSSGSTLSGRGVIDGQVVIAAGDGDGRLSAGNARPPSSLTINRPLTFKPTATNEFIFNSSTAAANQIVADQVTIEFDVLFTFVDQGSGVLPLGTVFVVINNTSALPIGGRFENIPDGFVVTTNGKRFLVNYEGGDGNDLTFTVVP